MPAEKTDAIVLRVVTWSETSSILTLFTRDFGKVRALAKGARRPKSPFESALDLLALCRIVFLRKSSDALDLVTEAKLVRRFRPGRNLTSLYAAYYVAELLRDLTDDDDPHPGLFDAAEQTLADLNAGGRVAPLVVRFELAALAALGHSPALSACAECGRLVERTPRLYFGQLAGGLLCKECRPGKSHVVSISVKAVETLEELANPTSDLWRQRPMDHQIAGEVRGVLNRYVSNLLGRSPRMHAYLGNLGG